LKHVSRGTPLKILPNRNKRAPIIRTHIKSVVIDAISLHMIRWCHNRHLVTVNLRTGELVSAYFKRSWEEFELRRVFPRLFSRGNVPDRERKVCLVPKSTRIGKKLFPYTYCIIPRKESHFLVYLLRGKRVTPNVKQLLLDKQGVSNCFIRLDFGLET